MTNPRPTDLDQALADISSMRSQMARGVLFQGYGPAALVATGVIAAGAALAQASWLPDPAANIPSYLALWAAVAIAASGLIGLEAIRRSKQAHGGLADEMLYEAAEQFLPAGLAGVLLTGVIQNHAPQALWMLPGLWQIILSLGVFAACRSLPRALMLVAVWYLTTGLACIALANGPHALSPWLMGAPFLIGQCLAAILLHVGFGTHHGA
jgi:hypothetical protein